MTVDAGQAGPGETVLSFPARVGIAARRLARGLFVVLVIVALLYPANGVARLLYPVAFGVPLAWSAARSNDSTFRWWSAYLVGFLAFVILRNAADDIGPPAAFD